MTSLIRLIFDMSKHFLNQNRSHINIMDDKVTNLGALTN